MAISLLTAMPGRVSDSSGQYPYGKARDKTEVGLAAATPLLSIWANDIFGLQQRLLAEANKTPSGVSDNAQDSQYFDAMWEIFSGRKLTHNITANTGYSLTEKQNLYKDIVITDTGAILSGQVDIVFDNIAKIFVFRNSTQQNLRAKTAAGNGVIIKPNDVSILINDGANIISSQRTLNLTTGVYTASGINTITLTHLENESAPTKYFISMVVEFMAVDENTGNVLLNVDSLGNRSLLNEDGTQLIAGTIKPNEWVKAYYDGSVFRLVSTAGAKLKIWNGRQSNVYSSTVTGSYAFNIDLTAVNMVNADGSTSLINLSTKKIVILGIYHRLVNFNGGARSSTIRKNNALGVVVSETFVYGDIGQSSDTGTGNFTTLKYNPIEDGSLVQLYRESSSTDNDTLINIEIQGWED